MIRQEYPPMTKADLAVVKRALDLKRKHSLSAMPPPPATPKHLKRSFVDFSTPSSSSSSGSSTNVENKTPSPLANRRILRFQRVNGSIQGQSLESLSGNNGQWNWKEPPKKLRRTSIYLREDVTKPAVAMRRLSMGDLSPSERISPAVAYRRVTRIDSLPMAPYDAFRDAVKEDSSVPRFSRLNINQDGMEIDEEVLHSNSQPASPPVLKTTHNGLYWVHHTGAAQPKLIPVPNEEKKIVTFARGGRMFIRMYLGSPTQQSEDEDADDERESARSDSVSRSATPDDDGYMFVAGTQQSVDWQADLPERPMFSPVNWNQSSPGVASLDESIPPEETVPVSEQLPTPYNERIAEARDHAIDVDENYDQYARSMSGRTAIGKSQTPFHKEVSPFASAVENCKIPTPVKEGNHVSSLNYNIKTVEHLLTKGTGSVCRFQPRL